MAIEPVSIPAAAALNFGENDVRHITEQDGLGVPALQAPTRHLAQRDVSIAKKLNEVIEVVNNKEQYVPIPIPKTAVSPNQDEVVTNYRIPSGFEARVLNASIAASPQSSDIQLNVLYAEGYGNISGTSVASTSSEFTGGEKFSAAGEFIIQIRNTGSSTLEIVGSVMLTIRPTGTEGTVLIGAPPQVVTGPPGPKGDKGDTGVGTPGPTGSPGLNFRNDGWLDGGDYAVNDVVAHNFAGTSGTSSYRARTTHTASAADEPRPFEMPSTQWEFIAQAGGGGTNVGEQGPAGPPGGVPVYTQQSILGTVALQADYVGGVTDDIYEGGGSPSTSFSSTFFEASIDSGSLAGPPQGLAWLRGRRYGIFKGSIEVQLPQMAAGAKTNWTHSNTNIKVSSHGTNALIFNSGTGTYAPLADVSYSGGTPDRYTVTVLGNEPKKIEITVDGFDSI